MNSYRFPSTSITITLNSTIMTSSKLVSRRCNITTFLYLYVLFVNPPMPLLFCCGILADQHQQRYTISEQDIISYLIKEGSNTISYFLFRYNEKKLENVHRNNIILEIETNRFFRNTTIICTYRRYKLYNIVITDVQSHHSVLKSRVCG